MEQGNKKLLRTIGCVHNTYCYKMKKTVLVIEDDKSIKEVIRIILEDEGYSVILEDNVENVQCSITLYQPSVILLDVKLFGEDVSYLTKEIKSQSSLKEIPIILMSADNNVEAIAQRVGADAFLSKPFVIEDLIGLVRKQIKR
jgi:DNA-binding NtrC family response regulator